MPQRLTQTQVQRQVQRLSPQQITYVRLLEMPIMELEQKVRNEIIDNVAIEEARDERREVDPELIEGRDERLDVRDENENENDNYSHDYFDDDDYDTWQSSYSGDGGTGYVPDGKEESSLFDDLVAQISEYDVTDHQRQLIVYLIGSLNDQGFLDRSLQRIADELLISYNIETTTDELAEALSILQQFDPPGIGATSLQECLLIQLCRDSQPSGRQTDIAKIIVHKFYDSFIANKIPYIAKRLHLSTDEVAEAAHLITRLNPSPGASLNESASDRVQTTIPDVIIETAADGTITYVINDSQLPQIEVNSDSLLRLQSYQNHQGKMNPHTREAYTFTRKKIREARAFIEALDMRHQTLTKVMDVIIDRQRDFILSGDTAQLHPLTLAQVAEAAGYDISTISRVRQSKYCLIDGTVWPLSIFFPRTRLSKEGKPVVGIHVKENINALIQNESPQHPLTDDDLVRLLNQQGINITRRTVAKYRKDLGYPIATRRRH